MEVSVASLVWSNPSLFSSRSRSRTFDSGVFRQRGLFRTRPAWQRATRRWRVARARARAVLLCRCARRTMICFRHSALVGFLELPQQAWRHHVKWKSLDAVFRVDSELLATFDPHQGAIRERFILWEAFEGFELSAAHCLCFEILACGVILV